MGKKLSVELLPPATSRKEQLELEKLRAEVRKTKAEAKSAELKLAQELRANDDASSSEYEHRIYSFTGTVREGSVEECIATLGPVGEARNSADHRVFMDSPRPTISIVALVGYPVSSAGSFCLLPGGGGCRENQQMVT